MNNLFFIVKLPDTALDAIMQHCIGIMENQRRSVDGKKVVLKLPTGVGIPQIMQHLTPYSHSEILQVMATAEWTNPEFLNI